jgi:hypothetical protein
MVSPAIGEVATVPEQAIIDRVIAFVRRFAFLKDESMYRLVALWIIHTYLHDAFQYTSYLFIHSPEKECGKTRLLETLHLLVRNSTGIDCSPTAAVVARTAKGNTQLLDEGDGWPDPPGLQNILNAGFQRNGRTARCQQDSLGSFRPQELRVFCPRAIAGIGKEILSPTTRDRTFFIEMTRQKPGERRERLRERTAGPEAAALKREIEEWVERHREEIVALYDGLPQKPLPYLDALRDRTMDIAEPLAVILEVAYADDPNALAEARLQFCEAVAVGRDETNQYSEDHRTLAAIYEMMDGQELIEQPSVLAKCLNERASLGVNEFAVGEVLRRYGFRQRSVRKDGQPRKCYVIERSRLEDILARYASASTTLQS